MRIYFFYSENCKKERNEEVYPNEYYIYVYKCQVKLIRILHYLVNCYKKLNKKIAAIMIHVHSSLNYGAFRSFSQNGERSSYHLIWKEPLACLI